MPSVVKELMDMLNACNPLAESFRMARERFKMNLDDDVTIRLIGRRTRDGRQYNLPTANEVAALLVGVLYRLRY